MVFLKNLVKLPEVISFQMESGLYFVIRLASSSVTSDVNATVAAWFEAEEIVCVMFVSE